MMTDAEMFALTLAVWPAALWLVAWLVAGEFPAKSLKIRKRVLFNLFARSRQIRRSIIAAGQDTAAPDFGRGPPKT